MAVIYVFTVLILIITNFTRIPWFFYAVFTEAFKPEAIFGGAFGIALVQGVKRGLMSNEAGQGTITMAAAAATQLMGGSPSQIEYAAEMGLEHHLGLTCDPVCGLVQIPCIERNAYAAARALDASIYALYTDGRHRVSFDQVVNVMKQTGKDLPSVYKETAEGGLAKILGE